MLLLRKSYVLLPLGLAALLVGCVASGGGFLLSASGVGNANFGFCASRVDSTIAGDFEYQDKGAGVRIHGAVTEFTNFGGNSSTFSGTYVSQNSKTPGTGTFSVTVVDNGEGRPPKGDTLSISLIGGPFGGYTNSGAIQGGNIQVDPAPGAVCSS